MTDAYRKPDEKTPQPPPCPLCHPERYDPASNYAVTMLCDAHRVDAMHAIQQAVSQVGVLGPRLQHQATAPTNGPAGPQSKFCGADGPTGPGKR